MVPEGRKNVCVLGQIKSLEEMLGPPLLLHSYGGSTEPLSEDPLPREQQEGPLLRLSLGLNWHFGRQDRGMGGWRGVSVFCNQA